MKSLLLATTLACGFAMAGASGANALPATVVLRAEAPTLKMTPVDYYWNHHHWHHRRRYHGRWHYYN